MSPKPTTNPLTARRGISTNAVLTIAVVVVAVLVIGGVLLLDRTDRTGGDSADLVRGTGGHTLTETADGPVLVEFLDFQCPACAGYYANITSGVEADYADRITFVVRNFPLESHTLALPAARAAEAAALQGEYEAMYHALYDNYRQWAVVPDGSRLSTDVERARERFDSYAEEIGLDLDRFHRDVDSAAVRERIEADIAAGTRAGVTGTPTLFVDGTRFEPTGETFEQVEQQLRDLLDRKAGS